jgi:uncharacterized protein YjbI with pentapeptide repeats
MQRFKALIKQAGVILLLCSMAMGWGTPTLAAESTLELIKPMSYSNAELRGKDFSGQDLRASDFANANMDSANFSQADLRGAIFSASILQNANLKGANFQHALMDQVDFSQANLENAIFAETLLLRSTFESASIVGADFTDALLDGAQRVMLCQSATGINPTTDVETRISLDCRN